MTQEAARLLEEALRLSESERGDLAACLIESLDRDVDPAVERAWNAEIRQRLEDLDTGKVQPIPWPEARAMILDDRDDPAEA